MSMSSALLVRPAQLLFASCVALFTLLIIDGYVLNLLGFPANATVIFGMLVIEGIAIAIWVTRQPLILQHDSLETAGFMLVLSGTWLYFVYPSLPTLLPPSYAGDAANHIAYVNSIYYTERIFGSYPGGPALIVATLAHWLDWLPVRLAHPMASLWMGLTAGGLYSLACDILPNRRIHKATALFAVLAVYVPSLYFAGMLVGPQYFMTQVAAQLFILGFVLFLVQYFETSHPVWPLGMILCLIGITVSFPLWIVLPLSIFGSCIVVQWHTGAVRFKDALFTSALVVGIPALFWLAIMLTNRSYVPSLSMLYDPGAVISPSVDSLGGLFLVFPALGLLLVRRHGPRSFILVSFLVFALLQTLTMIAAGRILGWAQYWVIKSFYVWIYPLGLLAALPVASVFERLQKYWPRAIHAFPVFILSIFGMGVLIPTLLPPPGFAPLSESELQVALWARQHLNTLHVNYIGASSLTANWLVNLWDEHLPSDLFISFAALGPKTYEAWRDDPDWGEYLFVSGRQHLPVEGTMETIYRWGDSAIIRKPPVASKTGHRDPLGHFGDTLALVDCRLPGQTYHGGDTISLTTKIETVHLPHRQVVWRLQLRDLGNNLIVEQRIAPFDNKFPLQRWPDGITLSQPLTLTVPANSRPGLYTLQLGLYEVGNGEPQSFTAADGTQDDVIRLGQVKIAQPPVTTHELGAITRTDQRIGDFFRLLGYRIPTGSPLRPGDKIKLYLYWQSVVPVTEDFTVFVHLLDSKGALLAQQDSAPRGGTFPTSIWEPGEIIVDPFILTIPPDAPPGNYVFEIGMYHWPDGKRLSMTGLDNATKNDHLVLSKGVSIQSR
jgi:hypothetical protein